jgi:hypothetical protein
MIRLKEVLKFEDQANKTIQTIQNSKSCQRNTIVFLKT